MDVLDATPQARVAWIREALASATRDNLNLDFHLLDFLRKTGGYRKVQRLKASRPDSILVSDMSFAPLRFIRFQGQRCFKVSLLSFYANTTAILEHPEGYELVRAKLKPAGAA